ncbi:WxcM-like domain-containing protein [Flavobacterium macacae]|uniref:Sugar epimerase n=1 Tax=Flavobacterium macacae TaxID=2488993 RepID=A0A3P3W0C6_9FLAO|nr:WxcM-like domain-containing protein [Flavobacterium macacae]RRJ88485.1 sugar epimerase [Flavobacterium macacae]
MNTLKGGSFEDERGKIIFNNELDLTLVKRMYVVENKNIDICRAWQGHKTESRWFVAVEGSFEIKLVKIDDFENPSDDLEVKSFVINSNSMDSLHVQNGYASSIQALETKSKLAVFSDYKLGTINDNYKFDSQKWKQKIK